MKVISSLILSLLLLFIWTQLVRGVSATASAAAGAGYIVTKTADSHDGVCDSDCSLREAIQAANANPGTDAILLPSGIYTLTLSGIGEDRGDSGDLDISDSVVISGTGVTSPTIDGGGLDRVFHITAEGAVVSLYNLTIRNGLAPVTDTLGGGGILNQGTLTLRQVRLVNNQAARGGGLRNSLGSVLLRDCDIANNQAVDEGGGVFSDGSLIIFDSLIEANQANRGGGIGSTAKALIERVVLMSNLASQGGGIYSDNELEINDVSFSDNSAANGGGLYSHYPASVHRSTFSNNEAAQAGGGVYNDDWLDLINVTLSANIAHEGGGLYNTGVVSLLNVTIFKNSATNLGGGIHNISGVVNLGYSLLAQSENGNCVSEGGNILSQGYNIEDTNTCGLNASGDLPNTNPSLQDTLADNGGLTLTHAPNAGSPALDIGGNGCAFEDQRRVLRPVDANLDGSLACDSGAVELAPAGYIGFSEPAYQVGEEGGQVWLRVRRWGGSQAVGVHYATRDISAMAGRDYQPLSGNLTWAAGQTGDKTLAVPILDDIYSEGDEVFEVVLSLPSGGVGLLMDYYRARVTILANDATGPPEPKGGLYLPLIMR